VNVNLNSNPLTGSTLASLGDRWPGCYITEIDVDGHPFFTIGIRPPTEASTARARAWFRKEMEYRPEDDGLTEGESAYLDEVWAAEDARMSDGGSFFRKLSHSFQPDTRREGEAYADIPALG
jgi:hypothetical protein